MADDPCAPLPVISVHYRPMIDKRSARRATAVLLGSRGRSASFGSLWAFGATLAWCGEKTAQETPHKSASNCQLVLQQVFHVVSVSQYDRGLALTVYVPRWLILMGGHRLQVTSVFPHEKDAICYSL